MDVFCVGQQFEKIKVTAYTGFIDWLISVNIGIFRNLFAAEILYDLEITFASCEMEY